MNDSFGFEEPIIMTEDTKNRPPEKKKHEAGAIIAGIVSGLVLVALSPFITKMVDLTPTARGYLQNGRRPYLSEYPPFPKTVRTG